MPHDWRVLREVPQTKTQRTASYWQRRLGSRSLYGHIAHVGPLQESFLTSNMSRTSPSPPPPRISQTALFVAFLILLCIAEFGIPGGLTPRRATEEILSRRVAEELDVFSEKDPNKRVGGPYNIDKVHRQGLVHRGIWIFALDSHLRLLLAWRAPSMKTCPMTWSLIGEHSITNETLEQTAIRGLTEEARFIVRPRIYPVGQPFLFKYVYAKGTPEQRTDNQWTQAYVILPRGDALDFRSLDDAEAESKQSVGENLRYQGMSIPQIVQHTTQKPGFFCSKVQSKWILRTIPLVIRVLKTNEKRLFRAHLKEDWAKLVQKHSPVCCRASEHEVDVESVDVSACGVPCKENTADASDIDLLT